MHAENSEAIHGRFYAGVLEEISERIALEEFLKESLEDVLKESLEDF